LANGKQSVGVFRTFFTPDGPAIRILGKGTGLSAVTHEIAGAPEGIRTPKPSDPKFALVYNQQYQQRGKACFDGLGFSPFLFRLIPCHCISMWKQEWKQSIKEPSWRWVSPAEVFALDLV
jgi:hypothetical protein